MFEFDPKLGELLIGHALLTPKRLKAGLDAQVIRGGRIGTNLVELGFTTIDQLALILGEQHGVPAASQSAFENVSSAALGSMHRSMCAAYNAFPLLVEAGTLHLALLDPERLEIIHEVGKHVGMTILAYAAPQLRLLYYLEKHYQIRRPQRYLRRPPVRQPKVDQDRRRYVKVTPPPQGAIQPSQEANRRRRVRTEPDSQADPPLVRRKRQESASILLVDLGEVTSSTLLEDGVTDAFDLDIDIKVDAPPSPEVGVVPVDEALRQLAAAKDRMAVVRHAVQPVLPETSLVVLFLVREEHAVALAAWGTELAAEHVRTLVIPLNIPSLLKNALHTGRAVRGPVSNDSVQLLIANYLQTPNTQDAIAVPIRVGSAGVHVLCVQSQTSFAETAAGDLERLATGAAAALDRLMGDLDTDGSIGEATRQLKADAMWSGLGSGAWSGAGRAKALDIPRQEQNRFGRYSLLCRFASGGMANLYLARLAGPARFEKLIAIKKIHDHLSHDTEFIRRFSDEARLAAQIAHPNVVQVIELGSVGNSHYIAMEYVDGEDLAALLNRTELPYRISAKIIANAAAGLHAAHQLRDASGEFLNVVHRDVSPQNLLISYDGEVKVVDFGVAQARGNLAHSIVGTILGKLGYMAPEQARGEKLDRRVDVYALGIVLYEITTRQRLFKAESEAATLSMVLKGEVKPPRKIVSKYPKALERVVLKALQQDASKRYQSAEELQVGLEQYINSSGAPVLSGAIGQLMQSVFADRIRQKKELLQRVTA